MPRKSTSRAARPSSPPSPVPATYPGKRDDGTGLDEPLWTACRDMLDAVYKAKNGRWVFASPVLNPRRPDYVMGG